MLSLEQRSLHYSVRYFRRDWITGVAVPAFDKAMAGDDAGREARMKAAFLSVHPRPMDHMPTRKHFHSLWKVLTLNQLDFYLNQ